MNKVIGGKLYNTESAKKIAYVNWNISDRLSACEETLYRTKTGNYFLHGSGGPMSKYGYFDGQNTCGNEVITPISLEQAQKWASENLDAEKFEKIFGGVSEDTVQISATIPVSLKAKLDKEKSKTQETISELITRVLLAVLCDK